MAQHRPEEREQLQGMLGLRPTVGEKVSVCGDTLYIVDIWYVYVLYEILCMHDI